MTVADARALLDLACKPCPWCGDFLLLPDVKAFHASQERKGATAEDCNCVATRDAMVALKRSYRINGIGGKA